MQKTDFHEFEVLAEKVILELIAQNHFFIASKNTNSVLVQMMRLRGHGCSKTSSSVRKVAKCNFKSKGSKT